MWYKDYVINSAVYLTNVVSTPIAPAFNCFMTTLIDSNDPIYFKDNVNHPHWVFAMNNELNALELNETWTVTTLPPGKTAIGCKWLFKTKFNPDGSIDKHKARLVILGHRQ